MRRCFRSSPESDDSAARDRDRRDALHARHGLCSSKWSLSTGTNRGGKTEWLDGSTVGGQTTVALGCIQAAATHSCGDECREHRASPWPVPACSLLFTRGAAPVVEIPLQLSNAADVAGAPIRSIPGSACVPAAVAPTNTTIWPPAIAWMDIATTTDLYDGAPVMQAVLGYPAASGHHGSGRSPSRGRQRRPPGIVTQVRIQRLPLMAGGKLVDLVVQRNQASEPLLTPSSIAPSMK